MDTRLFHSVYQQAIQNLNGPRNVYDTTSAFLTEAENHPFARQLFARMVIARRGYNIILRDECLLKFRQTSKNAFAYKIQHAWKMWRHRRENAAAKIIQKYWEACAYDPSRTICQSRLAKKVDAMLLEFEFDK